MLAATSCSLCFTLRPITRESGGVPYKARWTAHHVALSPITALDELVRIFSWEVELTVVGVFFCAWVAISAIITYARRAVSGR